MWHADFILSFKGVEFYWKDKVMNKESPIKYIRVKEIEYFNKNVRIKSGYSVKFDWYS